MQKKTILLLSLVRLPVFSIILYLGWVTTADPVQEIFRMASITEWLVYTVSTFNVRLLLLFILTLGLSLLSYTLNLTIKPSGLKSALTSFGIFSISLIFFQFLVLVPNPLLRTLLITAWAACNALPQKVTNQLVTQNRPLQFFFSYGIGLAEILLPQTYFTWLHKKLNPNTQTHFGTYTSLILTPVFLVFFLTPADNQRILTLGEKIHTNPNVVKFAEGNYNWIEINAQRRELYGVGPEHNFVMIFNIDQLNTPPKRSKSPIDRTQSFGFNPIQQEVYVYNNISHELLYLTAPELKITRAIPIKDLSNGDVWVKWNQTTDTITLASEADLNTGTPFYLLDQQSGEVLASIPLPTIPTAYIIYHPHKPILYFNSFKDTYLVAWDMEKKQIIQQTETSPRTDRMEFDIKRNELLVASLFEGKVLKYDADTLKFKSAINTSTGDRTLALDPQRDVLLVGNFFNNQIKVIDLKTSETLNTYYLGPWIRTIALDVEHGVAYVSTARNLFQVQYAQP